MSDINNVGEERKENEANYTAENYHVPSTQNISVNPQVRRTSPVNNYRGQNNRSNEGVNEQNTQGYGGGYRPNYNNPYPANYNTTRGGEDMNYQSNYPANYPTNYQPYYERDDDDYYPYHHDHDHCCDYYDGYRPYYNRGNRYNMRYNRRYGYGRPNMQGCDPNCYPSMPQNTMWNMNYISDFISRPRVNNFLRGVGIATIGLIVAPAVARTLRPVLVKTVQGAMMASDEVKGIFADAKEDVEDIFAEAKWDGNNEKTRGDFESRDM